MAGQMASMPRKPANAQISQNGTSTEKNGSWRPIIAESTVCSMPVTDERPMIGAPSAPNATGAVLAISARPEAASGEKPSPIRMAPVTATGVPKPAAPSKNAPKLKATSSSCRRRSSVTPEIEFCNTLNDPLSVVRRCRKMMLRTIHPIGNSPETMPSPAALPAMAAGMPNTNDATTMPTTSASPAARCACM
ncbi:hypothetical protein D3C87_1394930 [compost metagenome]